MGDAVVVTLIPHVVALVQGLDLLSITLFLATILEQWLAQVSVVSEHLHDKVLCFHSDCDALVFRHSLDNAHPGPVPHPIAPKSHSWLPPHCYSALDSPQPAFTSLYVE